MIQIKPLEINQVPAFVDTHLQIFRDTYEGIYGEEVFRVREAKRDARIEHITKRLKMKTNYFYCALWDDFQIVGILIFSILDGHGILDAIYIKRKYQQKGYGTKFLQILEFTLQKFGVLDYTVYVSKLIQANQFFLKHHAKYVGDDPISIHGKDYLECEYVIQVGDNI